MSEPADPSSLANKLRRLRREEPASNPDVSAAELPAWVQRSLGRRSSASERTARADDAARRTLGAPRDVETYEHERGRFGARVTRYASDHAHGTWRLNEALDASMGDIVLLSRDDALGAIELERAVFLDVETTGLSGGAGTTSFLVALGRFDGDAFELWQGFLFGPENEAAMLAEVARRVSASSAVVSFFGKSFDRHRLEDKMRLHGVEPPFDALPHLDLYHPFVRLYRDCFGDGRLQTMERHLCGFLRPDDLPGQFAPEAWFDFLGDRAHRLEDVFQHNADDVLSLAVLAGHLGRTCVERRASGAPLGGPERERAASLARLLREAGRDVEALEWIERALERSGDEPAREERFLHADILRRTGATDRAVERLTELAHGARDDVALRSAVELAKHAEHRGRNAALALTATRRALDLVTIVATGARRRRLAQELEHRRARLERKLAARE